MKFNLYFFFSGFIHFIILFIKLCGGYIWGLGPLHEDTGVGLHKMVSEFLIWRLGEHCLFPEVRGEITVGLGNGIKSGLGWKRENRRRLVNSLEMNPQMEMEAVALLGTNRPLRASLSCIRRALLSLSENTPTTYRTWLSGAERSWTWLAGHLPKLPSVAVQPLAEV